MRTLKTRRASQPLGQTLVEFALVIPIFLLLLFGMVDMGRFVYLNSTLSQAAREGARLASVEASWMGSTDARCGAEKGPVCPANLAALRSDVLNAANRMMVATGTIASADLYIRCDAATATPPTTAWTGSSCTNNTTGGLVSVRVVFTFTPITPVVGQLFTSIQSAASATMVIN
jgi:Flp pilus assembly protein TadG